MSDNGDVLKLNIGAGDLPIEGYVSVDRKVGVEAYPLDYPDGVVDEVRASHVLEHFGTREVPDVLADWIRVLKPGGVLKIAVPDFAHIVNMYTTQQQTPQLLFAYTMGGQTDENDFHKSAFDEPTLRHMMKMLGLESIVSWESDIADCARLDVSLNLQGQKPADRPPIDMPRVVAVMSTAKLGFTENLFCAISVFGARNIPLFKHTGAFWGQCMERTMLDAVADGAEWIVALDYDTVFTSPQFDELMYLFGTHPEIDALAPWQLKREGGDMLTYLTDSNGDGRREVLVSEFDVPLSKAMTAHFGLTLFRVESLKKMSHPWFLSQPDPNGGWSDGRVDEDIHFWNKWKETGNTLYMANDVSIGHLQQVVTWPGRDFTPQYQWITDFQKNGVPLTARQ